VLKVCEALWAAHAQTASDAVEGAAVNAPRALVVEDAPEFAAMIVPILAEAGYDTRVAETGADALVQMRSWTPDLVMLDVVLPDVDGFEVCRRLREFSDAFVIMVSGRGDEVDKVVGLTVGADDYVTKPYSVREVAARISAIRRRPRVEKPGALRSFGEVEVDLEVREVTVAGTVVDLTRTEFDLLAVLVAEPRRAFSREDLITSVWGGGWFGDSHIVDVHMANLRAKLGEDGRDPQHIKTVRGVGFRLDPG
jgi:DNA-binding response OmpR family regulator